MGYGKTPFFPESSPFLKLGGALQDLAGVAWGYVKKGQVTARLLRDLDLERVFLQLFLVCCMVVASLSYM